MWKCGSVEIKLIVIKLVPFASKITDGQYPFLLLALHNKKSLIKCEALWEHTGSNRGPPDLSVGML